MMRNVLIYFGVETKKEILAKVRRVLKPDGYLLPRWGGDNLQHR